MSNQEAKFVTRDYLSRRINVPLEHVLFGLPTYTKLRAWVSIDDTTLKGIDIDGYVAISMIENKQSLEFKNTEVMQIFKPPILKKVLFTKYSVRPDLSGQVMDIVDYHHVYDDLINPIYSLEEVIERCKNNRIPYHKPAQIFKIKLNDPELNNTSNEPIYPTQLQLAIDAYHFWYHEKEEQADDVHIRKWLKTKSIELGIGYDDQRDSVIGISKKTEDTIVKIIKPD